jgi:hypothetical protein
LKKLEYNKVDVNRSINFLEGINLNDFPLSFLAKELDRYFPSIPAGLITIPKGFKLYRGRVHGGGPSYKSVKDFSYVPHDEKAKCNEYGRANLPTQSLFYASDNIDTAQMECITKEIQSLMWILSFGVWEVQEDIEVANIIPHGVDQKILNAWDKPREHFYNMMGKDIEADQLECVQLIIEFFNGQFSKQEIKSHFDYFYSVYLSQRLLRTSSINGLEDLYKGQATSGIKYSSVPMNYQGYNVVLNPELIDNKKLKLISTQEYISAISKGILYSKRKNESVKIENDIITWKNDVVYGSPESFIPASEFRRAPTKI